MTTSTFEIAGMSCGHCVKAVDKALQQATGVTVENVAIGSATVVFDEKQTDVRSIAELIEDAGYQVVSTN